MCVSEHWRGLPRSLCVSLSAHGHVFVCDFPQKDVDCVRVKFDST